MIVRNARVLLFWGIVGCLLFNAGCGNAGVAVEGHVTLNGVPADTGSITFAPADGKGPSLGTTFKNGKYAIAPRAGLPPGKKLVNVVAVHKTGRQLKAGPPFPAGTMIDEFQKASTEQTCEVVAGRANQLDFRLNSSGRH